MDAEPLISPDVLAKYAADAAREVPGVSALAESPLNRGRAVQVDTDYGALELSVHLELEWGRSPREVGGAVQARVREYVERMTGKTVARVDVVVERVGDPPA